jgi:hypothetical protein
MCDLKLHKNAAQISRKNVPPGYITFLAPICTSLSFFPKKKEEKKQVIYKHIVVVIIIHMRSLADATRRAHHAPLRKQRTRIT